MKMLLVLLIGGMLSILPGGGFPRVEAADKPVVVIAGFSSRVANSNLKLTKDQLLPTVEERLTAMLSGNSKFDLYALDTDTSRARVDEVSMMNRLGEGKIVPELQNKVDYIIFGYLTNLSGVKAQSGALILGEGKDQTVHAELSMRVMDAHTRALVFVTTSSAKRKGELKYSAAVLAKRKDSGMDEAVAGALAEAADDLAAQFLQAIVQGE